MLDELELYNLIAKYPNTKDLVNVVYEQGKADEIQKLLDQMETIGIIAYVTEDCCLTDTIKQLYDLGRADEKTEMLMPYDVESIEELIANVRTKAINDFVQAYINDQEIYDSCSKCERDDNYCCIRCFRDRYLET